MKGRIARWLLRNESAVTWAMLVGALLLALL